MAKLPRVGIVVLNYNGQDCLSRCLASLKKLTYQNFFVIALDNASSDDSFEMGRKAYPEATFVANTENKGFAAGMNQGMMLALKKGADWVWLLNNDTLVAPDALQKLVEELASRKEVGMASPLILNQSTEKIWFGKGRIMWSRMRVVHQMPLHSERSSPSYQSDFLTGCALFLKKEALERVGFFDERFFLYYEDADLSLRMRQAGFGLRIVPKATVFHSEQSTKNESKLYYLVFSGLLFFAKHAQGWQKLYLKLYVTIRRLKNRLDVFRGRAGALVVARAYQDFFHGY